MKRSMAGFKRLPADKRQRQSILSVFCVKSLVFFIIFFSSTRISWAKEDEDNDLLPTIIEAEEVPIQVFRESFFYCVGVLIT